MKALGGLVLAVALAACTTDPVRPTESSTPALSVGQSHQTYIVTLQPNADPRAVAASVGSSPAFVYSHALNGFAADLPDAAVAALARNPNVLRVERDGMAHINDVASWGLDRVDQRDLPLSGSFTPPNDGSGVTVYVIDTGIWTYHVDFGGRAIWGAMFVPDQFDFDCHGHGTHVAGTIGGAQYGIAKNVTLVSVKVLDCIGGGAWSWIIAGIDWVTGQKQQGLVGAAVANMSLGGGYNQSVNDAVTASIAAGVSYAIAAGNSGWDACVFSPASTPTAVTVGATAQNDSRATFSNYGACLDLFAPGVGITSAWTGNQPGIVPECPDNCEQKTISGTSMAAPHVAGGLALYLSANPSASPQQARDALVAAATIGKVTNPGANSPNRLLFVDWSQLPPEPPPPPPVDDASFNGACGGFTCSFSAVRDGAWDFGDGSSGSGRVVEHTFAPRHRYTVTHTVGTSVAARSVNCNPKKCMVQ